MLDYGIQDHTTELEEAKQKLKEYEALEAEIAKLRQQVAEVNAKNDKELGPLKAEVASTTSRLNATLTEITDLKTKYAESQVVIQKLKQEQQLVRLMFSDAQSDLVSLKEEMGITDEYSEEPTTAAADSSGAGVLCAVKEFLYL
jgi:chromosome segregation ATPase